MALPIAAQMGPAFGLLPDIAWGMTRHQIEPQERSIPDYPPPKHLRHLHDPWFFALLWDRVLEHIRNPVRVRQGDSGTCLVEVLGDMVIELAPDGQLKVRLWEVRRIGQGELIEVEPCARRPRRRDGVVVVRDDEASSCLWDEVSGEFVYGDAE